MSTLLIYLLNLPARARRIAALSVCLVALTIVLLAGWVIYLSLSARLEDIDTARAMVGRLDRMIAAGRLQPPASAPQSNGLFLTASSNGIVQAQLQNWLSSVARKTNIDLQSVDVLPPGTFQGAKTLGLAADIAGTQDALLNTLLSIETSRPVLLVDKLDLRANDIVRDASSQTAPVTLDGRIEFHGIVDIDRKTPP